MKKIIRRIVELDPALVEPNPNQPREDSNKEGIESLAANIEKEGIQNLTLIEKHPEKEGRYRIISGERRWHAVMHLGEKSVEFMLVEGIDDPFLKSVVENTNRKNLNPIEEARTIHRLRTEYKKTWTEVSDFMGESEQTLQNRVKLLDLPKEIRDMVAAGSLPSVHALRMRVGRDSQAKLMSIAHDLIAGRESPDFHFREITAHGIMMTQNKLPRSPDEFARRIAKLLGQAQSLPIVVSAFMELPKSQRDEAIALIHPSVQGKIRKAVRSLTSSMRMLASELEVELSWAPPQVKTDEKRPSNGSNGNNHATIPMVSREEALWVLSRIIKGKGATLTVDLSKSSLGSQLGLNGADPEPLVIGSFRFMQGRWGKEIPKGTSPEREFMMFVGQTRQRLGTPKFRRLLGILRRSDMSSDPVDLDLV